MNLDTAQFVTLGVGSDVCQHDYIAILLDAKQLTD